MTESLPSVLVRMLALWNGEPIDPVTVYAPGCVEDGDSHFDPQDVLPGISALRKGFPDLRFTLDEWFAAGNRYVLRMRATGTHEGPLETRLGIAHPTGNAVSMRGVEVFELEDDLIVAVWIGWNFGDLYEAIGASLPHRAPAGS